MNRQEMREQLWTNVGLCEFENAKSNYFSHIICSQNLQLIRLIIAETFLVINMTELEDYLELTGSETVQQRHDNYEIGNRIQSFE